ncbi:MAG: sodium-dependent transporter [Candidatus Aenigmatarchaeota archaeon]
MEEKWTNKYGFILASIGSAVGIGNIWRFPYIMAKNGGGTFVIIYLICVFLFGLPLMLLEISTGRSIGGSIARVFEKVFKKNKYLSIIPILTIFFILSYYLVITGWTLFYFVNSIFGNYTNFDAFSSSFYPFLFTIITGLIVFVVISLGVVRGIEKLSRILVPILFVLVSFLLIRSIIFTGSIENSIKYFSPNFSSITINTILSAISQSLFSLSLGTGIMLTYGGYLRRNEKIIRTSFIVVLSDTLISLASAFIIISFVSYFNISVPEGTQLSFVVFPKIFESIKFGYIFGVLFFLLLFIAAITSAVSMMEVIVKSVIDKFDLTRITSNLMVTIPLIFTSLLVSLTYTDIIGFDLLGFLDLIFGEFMTPISAVILCIGVSWHWKLNELIKEMGIEEELPLDKLGKEGVKMEKFIAYKLVLNLVKYLIPILLIFIVFVRLFGR